MESRIPLWVKTSDKRCPMLSFNVMTEIMGVTSSKDSIEGFNLAEFKNFSWGSFPPPPCPGTYYELNRKQSAGPIFAGLTCNDKSLTQLTFPVAMVGSSKKEALCLPHNDSVSMRVHYLELVSGVWKTSEISLVSRVGCATAVKSCNLFFFGGMTTEWTQDTFSSTVSAHRNPPNKNIHTVKFLDDLGYISLKDPERGPKLTPFEQKGLRPRARSHAVFMAVRSSNKLFLCGGYGEGGESLNDFFVWENELNVKGDFLPSGSWTQPKLEGTLLPRVAGSISLLSRHKKDLPLSFAIFGGANCRLSASPPLQILSQKDHSFSVSTPDVGYGEEEEELGAGLTTQSPDFHSMASMTISNESMGGQHKKCITNALYRCFGASHLLQVPPCLQVIDEAINRACVVFVGGGGILENRNSLLQQTLSYDVVSDHPFEGGSYLLCLFPKDILISISKEISSAKSAAAGALKRSREISQERGLWETSVVAPRCAQDRKAVSNSRRITKEPVERKRVRKVINDSFEERGGEEEEEEEGENEIHCICRTSSNEDIDEKFVRCDTCMRWFHPGCIGMEDVEFERIGSISWDCEECGYGAFKEPLSNSKMGKKTSRLRKTRAHSLVNQKAASPQPSVPSPAQLPPPLQPSLQPPPPPPQPSLQPPSLLPPPQPLPHITETSQGSQIALLAKTVVDGVTSQVSSLFQEVLRETLVRSSGSVASQRDFVSSKQPPTDSKELIDMIKENAGLDATINRLATERNELKELNMALVEASAKERETRSTAEARVKELERALKEKDSEVSKLKEELAQQKASYERQLEDKRCLIDGVKKNVLELLDRHDKK